MRHNRTLLTVAFLSFCGHALAADSPEIRPGVWAARQQEILPLPTQGYEVYLVGEVHGLQENEEFQLRYLEQLHRVSGLHENFNKIAVDAFVLFRSGTPINGDCGVR
jgi:hypothetical protein